MKTNTDEMLTVKEVMAFLKVSRSKIYRLIDAGALKPYKIGERGTRFKRSDVEAYVRSQEQQ